MRDMTLEQRTRYRLRVDNCIATIIDVHKTTCDIYNNEKLLAKFEKLRSALKNMKLNTVSENDVLMVEEATNTLLLEFKPAFESGNCGPISQKSLH